MFVSVQRSLKTEGRMLLSSWRLSFAFGLQPSYHLPLSLSLQDILFFFTFLVCESSRVCPCFGTDSLSFFACCRCRRSSPPVHDVLAWSANRRGTRQCQSVIRTLRAIPFHFLFFLSKHPSHTISPFCKLEMKKIDLLLLPLISHPNSQVWIDCSGHVSAAHGTTVCRQASRILCHTQHAHISIPMMGTPTVLDSFLTS